MTKRANSTEKAKRVFIDTMWSTANVSLASRRAHIDRKTAYNWRGADLTFTAAWERAVSEYGTQIREVTFARRQNAEALGC